MFLLWLIFLFLLNIQLSVGSGIGAAKGGQYLQ